MAEMKVVSLIEEKAKKDGEVTVKSLAEDLMKAIERGEVNSLVLVSTTTDGEIVAGYSNVDNTEILGMLEVGKHIVIDDMFK